MSSEWFVCRIFCVCLPVKITTWLFLGKTLVFLLSLSRCSRWLFVRNCIVLSTFVLYDKNYCSDSLFLFKYLLRRTIFLSLAILSYLRKFNDKIIQLLFSESSFRNTLFISCFAYVKNIVWNSFIFINVMNVCDS